MKIILRYPFFRFSFSYWWRLENSNDDETYSNEELDETKFNLVERPFQPSRKRPTLNDLANTHGYNSRMWHNVSPARHWPKYAYLTFATLQNAKIRAHVHVPSNCLNNNCRASDNSAAMNHRRVPNAATKLHMPALLTQCSDMKYVHARVTHALCCCRDVSHWDIQAVEVIVDWLQNGPPPQHPDAAYYARKLL